MGIKFAKGLVVAGLVLCGSMCLAQSEAQLILKRGDKLTWETSNGSMR